MSWPPDRGEWPPLLTGLESGDLSESTVRVVRPSRGPEIMSIDDAVKGPLRADLASSAAERARLDILENAARHVGIAAAALSEAVDWFAVVDRSDHADLVRQVEALADTIAYRLRNAGG